jgi:hypothetical protein
MLLKKNHFKKSSAFVKILSYIVLIVFSPYSHAAWWLDINYPHNEQEVSDDPLEFKLNDLNCGVTKTEFIRDSNDRVHEFRFIYCENINGMRFSVQANCRLPEYTLQQLLISKGTIKYFPTLVCGPAKKNNN